MSLLLSSLIIIFLIILSLFLIYFLLIKIKEQSSKDVLLEKPDYGSKILQTKETKGSKKQNISPFLIKGYKHEHKLFSNTLIVNLEKHYDPFFDKKSLKSFKSNKMEILNEFDSNNKNDYTKHQRIISEEVINDKFLKIDFDNKENFTLDFYKLKTS